MILKQCENLYVDWPIGGAITVTKVYKCCISMADPINGAFPLHGTAQYGSVRFTFGGFSTGYCTWYLILF